MGLFDRSWRRTSTQADDPTQVPEAWRRVEANVYDGDVDLDVVGEASYQEALWNICGGMTNEHVRHPVVAALVPEPSNPYDANAISIQIDGCIVGYLSRDNAAAYGPSISRMMSDGSYVALRGVVVGGGMRDDGRGRLGVWLQHDPADFGIMAAPVDRRPSALGSMRTGLTEAQLSDAADDSYNLSALDALPIGDRPAIAALRDLLAAATAPIERHFLFAELTARLYKCRDLETSALADFDDACEAHDAEMDVMREAFMAKWGKVPMVEMYRQMAIRQQKQGDWGAVLRWVERGLAVYGSDGARTDAAEDLEKRRNRARSKLGS